MTYASIEKTIVELLEVRTTRAIPIGLWRRQLDVRTISEMTNEEGDYLLASLSALVYGKHGALTSVSEEVVLARFPRWFPQRLQRWLSRRVVITVDTRPSLVWPDATLMPPNFGRAVEIFSTTIHPWREIGNEVNAGWV